MDSNSCGRDRSQSRGLFWLEVLVSRSGRARSRVIRECEMVTNQAHLGSDVCLDLRDKRRVSGWV